MLNDAPESIDQVARKAVDMLRERLPRGWNFESVEAELARGSAQRPDYLLKFTAPNGETGSMAIEAKRIVERRDLASIQRTFERDGDDVDDNVSWVLAARYLSPQVRTELNARGLSYIDATGNMRVSLPSPALYISDRGADSDPWRGAGRPRGTLKGEPAARVVRTLLDYVREWRIKDLVNVAGSSVGATYRVIEYLEKEGLVSGRNEAGELAVREWPRLLREWSADYNALQSNRVRQYFEPRGVSALLERVVKTETFSYAVTGSVAAAEWAPYAPSRSAFIYVSNAEAAEKDWGLRRSEANPNVLLIEPKSPKDIVFANTDRRQDGLVLAAPAQVAVDLMNGPGRNPAEAEELLEWMTKNEGKWRKQ